MKAIFSVVGLLVVLAIVGVLAKRQLSSGVAPAAAPAANSVPGVAAPSGNPASGGSLIWPFSILPL